MKPYVFSEKTNERYGLGWRQAGSDTSYLNQRLRYYNDYEDESDYD
jgi:hypothetical protein